MDNKYTGWELSTGLVPGFVIGFRTYNEDTEQTDYVLYLGIIDVCLTFNYE